MRRSFTKLSNPIGNATKQTILSSSPFSTFSGDGGGRGRGRGRGSDFPNPQFFTPTNPAGSNADSTRDNQSPLGRGHGRGQSSQPPPINPTFTRPVDSGTHGVGRGVGGGGPTPFTPSRPPLGSIEAPGDSISKKPTFLKTEEPVDSSPKKPEFLKMKEPVDSPAPNQALTSSIFSILSDDGGGLGRGRGKPVQLASEKPRVGNRHIRERSPPPVSGSGRAIGESERESTPGPKLSREEAVNRARNALSRGGGGNDIGEKEKGKEKEKESSKGPKLSREEAINRARSVLSRGEDGDGGGGNAVRGGRGGGRGRGRGRGRASRRGGGRATDFADEYDDDEYEKSRAIDAAQANEEAFRDAFVKDFGQEKADLVFETFEEATDQALPCPMRDAFGKAMDLNYRIELEPEYLMDFENPDIDEKPPIPLRDALEKMKPFLMAYEDIETDEGWEEVVKAAMDNVPYMEMLVDKYSGRDRTTAKQEQEELERVAKTLPESAPSSVKLFTDRAILSLQSNPGWAFNKKQGFMDKLVREMSQSYK